MKWSCTRAAEFSHVSTASEGLANVETPLAHVRTSLAPYPEQDISSLSLEQLDVVDLPLSQQPSNCGAQGWALVDLPLELLNHLFEPVIRHIAVQVHQAHVLLSRGQQGLNHLRRILERDRQYPADIGVERATMASSANLEQALNPSHYLVRSWANWFVEVDDAQAQMLVHRSSARLVAMAGICDILSFDQHFALDIRRQLAQANT